MNFRNIPPVIKNLIIVNILVYVAQYMFSVPIQVGGQIERYDKLAEYGGLWATSTGNFKIWQLITHMFMHDVNSIFHILFNMFTLWMFGSILEMHWGGKKFFNFYMICGIMAGVTQLAFGNFDVAVGASGAIMGVMAAFAYLFPNTPLYVFFVPVPIKAKYVIPAFMALDLFGGIARVGGDNIAHWAHLGGALTGFLLVFLGNKMNRKTFY
ncbi:rhomboid family intramembrane serine protease [Pinibacter aurantiacus]|uniref:Rhomboid family intramembrane serine protease n=1 Tax=Pinibacter aurantiacus TaxID=2851599 RepID=A0A9E2S8F6_9BACT|nr:rhomboid family intramembrane serine protease [Pinibacter aurantiacus]MBV4356454.1 rhomboid family intramembrane serine protease [Pinibacter aurantiacus]